MAGLWFWSFHILVVILMLNMLLAIIMDTYSGVKQRATRTETLLEEFLIILRRLLEVRTQDRVKLVFIRSKLLEKYGVQDISASIFDPEHCWPAIVTCEHFIKDVVGLKGTQARRVMIRAVE